MGGFEAVVEIPLGHEDDGDQTLPVPPNPGWNRPPVGGDEAERLGAALQRLPDEYRQVIVLYHKEHRSLDEVALLTGMSLDAVRKVWARAVERLAEELKGNHEHRQSSHPGAA